MKELIKKKKVKKIIIRKMWQLLLCSLIEHPSVSSEPLLLNHPIYDKDKPDWVTHMCVCFSCRRACRACVCLKRATAARSDKEEQAQAEL